jgi:hypothetical protein
MTLSMIPLNRCSFRPSVALTRMPNLQFPLVREEILEHRLRQPLRLFEAL